MIEAGPHNEHLENVHMVGGQASPPEIQSVFADPPRWSQNFDNETDWNIVSEKKSSVNDRQI